jgi:three-Cys-motif partner protein
MALKNQGFVRIYVDAFAGSGDRTHVLPALPLLGDEHSEPQVLTVPGSARLALEVEPSFDLFVLIENDPKRYASLEKLTAEYPSKKIHCHPGDANAAVRRLCGRLPWHGSAGVPRGMRAVIFLDPYGMEVEWETIKAIAATQAIDLWYFFPLMGLYRQASREIVAIDGVKRNRLNSVLGSSDWEAAWYSTPHGTSDLFEDPTLSIRTAEVNAIEKYVKARLKAVFKGTVLDPLRLHNTRGAPLASLFFAVSNPNPKAVRLATEIASHLLAPGR